MEKQYYTRFRMKKRASQRGIRNTKMRIVFPSPAQQQRVNQMPKAISSTASANHQKPDGSTSDRMITSPARIAAVPSSV